MQSIEVPNVLVDMDGVLADFDGQVINVLRNEYPDIPIKDVRTHFYISDDYPEHALLIREISDRQGFFESLPLLEEALEGWQRIINLGYHPRVCSAPMISNPYSNVEKISWLEEYFVPVFGKYVVDEAIINSEKYLYDGIAIIDDRPKLKGSEEASWMHILYDQPYNRAISEHSRIVGLLDNNLPRLLEIAKKRYLANLAG
jgi:5'-nucleotidase